MASAYLCKVCWQDISHVLTALRQPGLKAKLHVQVKHYVRSAGEAAGLRVPELGRNAVKQSHVGAYNLLFHSALPRYGGGKGKQAVEYTTPVGPHPSHLSCSLIFSALL